jgi:hypothetical protein
MVLSLFLWPSGRDYLDSLPQSWRSEDQALGKRPGNSATAHEGTKSGHHNLK